MKRLGRRRTRLLISLIITLVASLAGYQIVERDSGSRLLPIPAPGTYNVVRVEDGDTITIDMNGNEERVRFIGIDTPETQDPRKPVQCFGKAATEFTRQLIDEQVVRLEADPVSGNRDRYNRLLRYVYLPDGRMVQAEVVRQGYGFAYVSFPFTKSEEFLKYQQEAREQNRGLWSNCSPETNEFGGFTSNPE